MYWELVYADCCLKYIKEFHPEIYKECGDDFEKERQALITLYRDRNKIVDVDKIDEALLLIANGIIYTGVTTLVCYTLYFMFSM